MQRGISRLDSQRRGSGRTAGESYAKFACERHIGGAVSWQDGRNLGSHLGQLSGPQFQHHAHGAEGHEDDGRGCGELWDEPMRTSRRATVEPLDDLAVQREANPRLIPKDRSVVTESRL